MTSNSNEIVISAEDVGKTYDSVRGNVTALKGLNLAVRQGQFVSVVGASGCGKSTLMRCIAGLELISIGSMKVHGKEVDRPLSDAGIVFQRDVLLDWRKVIDNVLLPAELRHPKHPKWRGRAISLLEKLGLADFQGRYPWELSGGMRQRVAICRALIDDPKLLLMDEPFGALDAMTREDLNVELQRIWLETHKTVVFITHSISEAVFLGDKVVVMAPRPGRIVDVLDVDIPRPRDLSCRETPAFGRYTTRIRDQLALSAARKSPA